MSDIESLLADILDDSKPLPTTKEVVVNTIANHGPAALPIAAENLSDEDYLERLMNGDAEPEATITAIDVAEATEVQGDMAMADAGLTQCVNGPEDPVDPSTNDAVKVFTDTEERANPIEQIKIPSFVGADFAETMDIRNFATLVTLNTSRWHAKVKDRQAGKNAASVTEADEASFEVRKRLLVGADTKLKAIHKAIDEARALHYDMTLPWSTTSMSDAGRRTGGRLLPNTLFVEYTQAMAAKLKQMVAALDEFVPEYPNLIELAKVKLGKSFDAREYPNASSIRQHFTLSFDFQPIPKGEDFGGLPKVQLDMLAAKVNDNMRLQAEHAMQELWVRLHTVVGRMAERLLNPENVFQNSLVTNVRDTARLLGHLNVTQDPKVEALRVKVEKELCPHDAKDLREKPVLRTKVGAMAASIIQEMDA
jgi:hypothetical protein